MYVWFLASSFSFSYGLNPLDSGLWTLDFEFCAVRSQSSIYLEPPPGFDIKGSQVIILPVFHRTHVTSNAVGLLLCYTLDSPPHGLGLRRSVWQAHAQNQASRRAASRMGYTFEGIQRFQRVMPEGKQSNEVDVTGFPSAIADLGPSRDTAVFAHYCDEWAEKRKEVWKVMERK